MAGILSGKECCRWGSGAESRRHLLTANQLPDLSLAHVAEGSKKSLLNMLKRMLRHPAPDSKEKRGKRPEQRNHAWSLFYQEDVFEILRFMRRNTNSWEQDQSCCCY